MNKNRTTAKMFIYLIAVICSSEKITTPTDPYASIRYTKAFDQENIYKKHKKLLQKWGCLSNTTLINKGMLITKSTTREEFENISSLVAKNGSEEIQHASNDDNLIDPKEIEEFEKDCLKSLNSARFMVLAEPCIYSAMHMALIIGAAAGTSKMVGSESMGGSFAVYGSLTNALLELPRIIKTGYRVISKPDNCLKDLEEHYAKNKCFIPQVLWSKIETAFIEARQNAFAREKNLNFLHIALNFTTYKPKSKITLKHDFSIEMVKETLNLRIDQFFQDYDQRDQGESLFFIKINVSKFIDSLFDGKAIKPRYLYLHGLGGIGKTHFVQTLAKWVDELIPDNVIFEDLVIHSAQELEGSSERPSAFLRVLQKQLSQQKAGSIVIIDEATWLNDYGMTSCAKRSFNGDCSKLSTAYFGTDLYGAAVTLDMPPMLIMVASNDPIKDNALASRFDICNYPSPTLDALAEHAYNKAKNSLFIKKENYQPDQETIKEWITGLPDKDKNFRQVAGDVEAFVLANKEKFKNS